MSADSFDAIVVGAGPAGSAAAFLLAKEGWEVILLERGDYPGAKNVMGGVLYRTPLEELVPSFWREAPIERYISEQRIWILSSDSGFCLSYKSDQLAREPYNAFTVLRAKFDPWFAGKAETAGATLVTKTVVEELICENGKVVGVRVGRGEGDIFAPVVIVADGVNSVLARRAGFRSEIRPHEVALAVKEVISLPPEKIEDRFNLEAGEGTAIELIGHHTKGQVGMGFIYTNRESLSVGVGVLLSDLANSRVSPHELIEGMKSHPLVRRLLEGGKTVEYSAHLIPEAGWKAVPLLCADGVMIAGDAAMLVNSLHREGSNMALASGMLAARTALKARAAGDFSVATLKGYRESLEESFVLRDLKKYRLLSDLLLRRSHFLSLYPEIITQAVHDVLLVDSVPKEEKFRRVKKKLFQKRSPWGLISDLWQIWRALG